LNTTGTTGTPLETPLGKLINVDEILVTTGIPLETPLGWGEGTHVLLNSPMAF
jgi:hypothetical protein